MQQNAGEHRDARRRAPALSPAWRLPVVAAAVKAPYLATSGAGAPPLACFATAPDELILADVIALDRAGSRRGLEFDVEVAVDTRSGAELGMFQPRYRAVVGKAVLTTPEGEVYEASDAGELGVGTLGDVSPFIFRGVFREVLYPRLALPPYGAGNPARLRLDFLMTVVRRPHPLEVRYPAQLTWEVTRKRGARF